MAGHSHWANISIKKGIADKKRGKIFGKCSRLLMVAARRGGPDPGSNLALRYAIEKAKQSSMPKETIERAIKKGSGELEGADFVEILYEGRGPYGVALLCDILTDNRNRTAGEVRKIFEVHGGELGKTGCAAWMFDRKGLFVVSASSVEEDRLMEVALDAGADDIATSGPNFEVTCKPEVFQVVNDALTAARIATDVAEVSRIANEPVDLTLEQAREVMKLIEALEDNDDVQSVTSNLALSEALMTELSA